MEERIWEYYWLCWHNIPSPFWKKKEKKFVSWDGNDARKLLKRRLKLYTRIAMKVVDEGTKTIS